MGFDAVARVSPGLARLQIVFSRFRILLISLYISFGGLVITRLAILFGDIH